jgi:hypothetical protein
MQHAKTEDEIREVLPKGKLLKISHEKECITRRGQILSSNEDRLREIYQDNLSALGTQKTAPATDAAAQIADSRFFQFIRLNEIEVLLKLSLMLR